MSDETPNPPATDAADPGKRDVTPIPKAGKAASAPAKAAKKASKSAKAPAKKAAAAKKSASTGPRSKSTVSKEGTMTDSFTGEKLPVTAFPTYKDKDGNVVRRTVARANQEAYRAAEKERKAKEKAAKDQAKAATKASKAPAKKAAAAKKAS